MLQELLIQQFALIDSLTIRFDSGLTVFTGETGAGKSIILDAIGLVLGARGSSDWIRTGSDTAVVEAVFQVGPSAAGSVAAMLNEWGIPSDGDTLLVSRELHRSGRSACRINGRMATVQMLRELGARLIQQHGQHEHQVLLKADEQSHALDLYAGHMPLVTEVAARYRRYMDLCKQVEQSSLDEQARIQRLDMLQFQIDEIEHAQLRIGEEELLREQRNRLLHVDKIATALSVAIAALDDGSRSPGAISLIAGAIRELGTAAQFESRIGEAVELLETAHVHVEEALRILHKNMDTLEADPDRLQEVESRLAQIRSLARKYGPDVDEILNYLDRAKREREELAHHDERLRELSERMVQAEGELHEACMVLHQSRTAAANTLGSQVEQILRQLNMPNARFEVEVNLRTGEDGRPTYGERGADTVQFLFSANKGEGLRPLAKIASGGELSRLMLALKSVLARTDDVETMIFDEIDTGVSGAASQSIARQLALLANDRQVLCVTHSPQIAAAGHHHHCIEKVEDDDGTRTFVRILDGEGRVQELARLLGAAVSDETAVTHARALLNQATLMTG